MTTASIAGFRIWNEGTMGNIWLAEDSVNPCLCAGSPSSAEALVIVSEPRNGSLDMRPPACVSTSHLEGLTSDLTSADRSVCFH
jgi:hypothetical protein